WDKTYAADNIVLATDFKQTQRLIGSLGEVQLPVDFGRFVAAPITTVHLWYDRDVTGLDHAVLLDTRIQWVFVKSRIRRWGLERGSYVELVISASWSELAMG